MLSRSDIFLRGFPLRRFGFVSVIFFFAISSFGSFSRAAPDRIDCNILLRKASKSGEIPKVTLNTSWGIIRIETPLGYCREPVEVWKGRHLKGIPVTEIQESNKIQLPKTLTTPEPVPPKPTAPEPVPPKPAVPEPVPPKPTVSEPVPPKPAVPELVAPKKYTAPVPTGKPCDKSLDEFWKQGKHSVKGTTYLLSQVYTIDRNSDGFTENVGFRLKAGGGKPDLLIRYFAHGNQISARSLPRLALPDETVISRICFGQVIFAETSKTKPVPVDKKKVFDIPDLARDMKIKTGEISEEPETTSESDAEKTISTTTWLIIAAGLFVFFAASGLIAFLTRKKWLPKLKKSEDDDDEDDDDEDEF